MNDIDLIYPVFHEFYQIEKKLKTAEKGSKERAVLLRKHSIIFDKLYESGWLFDYWTYCVEQDES